MLDYSAIGQFEKPYNKYKEIYGSYDAKTEEIPLHKKPIEIEGPNGTTTIKKYVVKREGAKKPYKSVKKVTLPENSPLRKLNIDKFVLTTMKTEHFNGDVEKGVEKAICMFNKEGEAILLGRDNIRQFMKAVRSMIR